MKALTKILAGLALSTTLAMPVQAADLKIGVIDMRAIIAASPQAKESMEKLKKEFKGKEDKIVAQDKALKEKAEKLQRNGSVMGEAEKSKIEKELMSGQRDLQRMQAEFREDATIRQQEEMKKVMERVNAAVQNIAEKEKYDLILPSDGLPFASKTVNITDKVIKAIAPSA